MKQLMLLGLILIPFSTGVDSGLPVVSFGLPFLTLALAVSLVTPSADGFRMPRAIAPAILAAAGVVCVISVSALFAPSPERSLARVFPSLVCFPLVFRLLGRYRLDTERTMLQVARWLAVSGGVMAAYFILHLIVAILRYGANEVIVERYTGGAAALPWGASNIISAALIFPHIAACFVQWRTGARWPSAVRAVILLAVVLTLSRAGFLTHGLLLLGTCLLSRRYKPLLLAVLTMTLLVWLYAQLAPDNFDLLMNTRFSENREISNGRFDSFAVKADYILDNLMTPVGYYGSLEVFGMTSHNVFLTVLVEQGIPGLAAMLAFCGSCWHALYRARHLSGIDAQCRSLLALGAGLAFMNLLVEDANFTQPYIVYFWMFFFIVMAFSARTRLLQAPERASPMEAAAYARC